MHHHGGNSVSSFGIAPEQVRVQVLGEEEPVTVGKSEGALALNRRGEVVEVRGQESSQSSNIL
jgi:outer membrane protein OmpA-like peptidoglycan-associated protein